jgi:hypothetical protein
MTIPFNSPSNRSELRARKTLAPALHERFQSLPFALPNEKKAGALRSQHPFVTVGSQVVDWDFLRIEAENAKSLDRIHE